MPIENHEEQNGGPSNITDLPSYRQRFPNLQIDIGYDNEPLI